MTLSIADGPGCGPVSTTGGTGGGIGGRVGVGVLTGAGSEICVGSLTVSLGVV